MVSVGGGAGEGGGGGQSAGQVESGASEVVEGDGADDATGEESGDDGGDDGGQMQELAGVARGGGGGEHGSGSSQVGDGLMVEPEEPDGIDDAGEESEPSSAGPDPARQLGDHGLRGGGEAAGA